MPANNKSIFFIFCPFSVRPCGRAFFCTGYARKPGIPPKP